MALYIANIILCPHKSVHNFSLVCKILFKFRDKYQSFTLLYFTISVNINYAHNVQVMLPN